MNLDESDLKLTPKRGVTGSIPVQGAIFKGLSENHQRVSMDLSHGDTPATHSNLLCVVSTPLAL